MKSQYVTNEMKGIAQCFHSVRFIIRFKAVLTPKSVNKTPASEHSNESY